MVVFYGKLRSILEHAAGLPVTADSRAFCIWPPYWKRLNAPCPHRAFAAQLVGDQHRHTIDGLIGQGSTRFIPAPLGIYVETAHADTDNQLLAINDGWALTPALGMYVELAPILGKVG